MFFRNNYEYWSYSIPVFSNQFVIVVSILSLDLMLILDRALRKCPRKQRRNFHHHLIFEFRVEPFRLLLEQLKFVLYYYSLMPYHSHFQLYMARTQIEALVSDKISGGKKVSHLHTFYMEIEWWKSIVFYIRCSRKNWSRKASIDSRFSLLRVSIGPHCSSENWILDILLVFPISVYWTQWTKRANWVNCGLENSISKWLWENGYRYDSVFIHHQGPH